VAKGSYPGGGTIIGPQDVSWYGNSGIKVGMRPDAADIARRQSTPLTAKAEQRIAELRGDLLGLNRELAAIDRMRETQCQKISRAQKELATILYQHGLPLDPELKAVQPSSPTPAASRPNRHARRKAAKQRREARKQQHD
jgi:hypothetical protein